MVSIQKDQLWWCCLNMCSTLSLHCKKKGVHDTHVVCIWRQIWCAVHTHLSLYAHQLCAIHTSVFTEYSLLVSTLLCPKFMAMANVSTVFYVHPLLDVCIVELSPCSFLMAKLVTFLILSSSHLLYSFCSAQQLGCKENSCEKCFNFLVNETIYRDENQYNLQKTFFPPSGPSPPFVTVHYQYVDDNGTDLSLTKVWFWSSSGYYFFDPPSVLQYTSLLFAEPAFHMGNVTLTLDSGCYNASDDYMELLTQRVRCLVIAVCLLCENDVGTAGADPGGPDPLLLEKVNANRN